MKKLKLFLSLVFRRGDGMWFTPALAWEVAGIMNGEYRLAIKPIICNTKYKE